MNKILRYALASLAILALMMAPAMSMTLTSSAQGNTHANHAKAQHAKTQHEPVDIPIWVTRPCRTEDSVNCRWIASEQGNGHGHTNVRRLVPGPKGKRIVCVFFTQRRYAANHDYCS